MECSEAWFLAHICPHFAHTFKPLKSFHFNKYILSIWHEQFRHGGCKKEPVPPLGMLHISKWDQPSGKRFRIIFLKIIYLFTYLFKLLLLLKHSWLTMFLQVLLYSKVIQSYTFSLDCTVGPHCPSTPNIMVCIQKNPQNAHPSYSLLFPPRNPKSALILFFYFLDRIICSIF